jgi:hypothetical protein
MPAQVRPPRTLDAGRTEVTTGLRITSLQPFAGYSHPNRESKSIDPGLARNTSTSAGLAPAAAIRYGLTDRLEFGAGFSGPHSSAESTYQLVRTSAFDLSLGLSIGVGLGVPAVNRGTWQPTAAAPLTAGVNLGRNISLIAMGAPAYLHDALHTQVGAGVDLRLSGFVALRPTASWLVPFPGNTYDGRLLGLVEHPYALVGIDVAFGGDRRYDATGLF